MNEDPIVVLERQLSVSDAKFDAAISVKNSRKARRHWHSVSHTVRLLDATLPTTPAGAAVLVRQAASYLFDAPQEAIEEADRIADALKDVAARFDAGQWNGFDLDHLRSIKAMMAAGWFGDAGIDAAPVLGRALRCGESVQ